MRATSSSFDVVDDGRQGVLHIELHYGQRGEQVINSIDRVSKPGRRVYKGADDLPKPIQGLGIAVVSTSRGVMSDRKCREQRVGGEVVAIVT
jgi:small subunit ribosomal protein S8